MKKAPVSTQGDIRQRNASSLPTAPHDYCLDYFCQEIRQSSFANLMLSDQYFIDCPFLIIHVMCFFFAKWLSEHFGGLIGAFRLNIKMTPVEGDYHA